MKTSGVTAIFVSLVIAASSLALVPAAAAQSQPVQIVNVIAHVVNDADSGACSYWALDNYSKLIKVWQLADGNFQVNESFSGFFETPAGAVSPNANCVTLQPAEGFNAVGTFHGAVSFVISGAFAPTGAEPTRGFVGSYDYGTTLLDLQGTYATQSVVPTYTNMLLFYFPGGVSYVSGTPSPFDFVYRYQSQTWVDSSSGLFGNIAV